MWLPVDLDEMQRYEELDPGTAFWLEHWLFIHSDEAFGFAKARPLGLHTLAGMVSDIITAEGGRALVRVVVEEIEQYRKLFDALQIVRPQEEIAFRLNGTLKISSVWAEFIMTYQKHAAHLDFLKAIAGLIRDATAANDRPQIAYLSRRFAGELSDLHTSPKWIYIKSRKAVLESGNLEILDSLIEEVSSQEKSDYVVSFEFARVETSARLYVEYGLAKLIFEKNSDNEYLAGAKGGKILIGIRIPVKATDVNRAHDKSVSICQASLSYLRLNFYVRTYIIGNSVVEGGDKKTLFSLRQPFWSHREGQIRPIPRFPHNFFNQKLFDDAQDRTRWHAAREHVSVAIATWSENCHHAASSVWQALECLSGTPNAVYPTVIPRYNAAVRLELLRWCRLRLAQHHWARVRSGLACDWPAANSRRSDIEWLKRLFSRGGADYFERWKSPPASPVLFGEVGLLSGLFRYDGGPKGAHWIDRRMELDLRHLYALRNSLVHRGHRIGTERWASYLASLGLEILISWAREKSSFYASSQTADNMASM
ncbi:hypothetical protein [Sphingomonas sp.]|jgi:hypothetical protein|uniref:hypothetical protein n=1 Tax=Sphingomonas sp. TaxID=28214 RepID=UPI002E312FAD|nr:hypothetical protein [Sphingomonas sp.]HEX4695099.1 hypothetical protein [Sphingomonas sp.]